MQCESSHGPRTSAGPLASEPASKAAQAAARLPCIRAKLEEARREAAAGWNGECERLCREVIRLACGCTQVDVALEHLDLLRKAGVKPDQPPLGAMGCLLEKCWDAGRNQDVVRCFEKMRECDIRLVPRNFTSMLSACGRLGQFDKAMDCLGAMKAADVRPEPGDWQVLKSILQQCARDGEIDRMLRCFAAMLDAGYPADLEVLKKIVAACVDAGRHSDALQQFGAAWQKYKDCSGDFSSVLSDLMASCATCGRHALVLRCLHCMRVCGFHPRLEDFNHAINAGVKLGQPDEVLRCWSELDSDVRGGRTEVRPDLITLQGLMWARLSKGDLAQADRCFEAMKVQARAQGGEGALRNAYELAIEACVPAGRPDAACRLFNEMVRASAHSAFLKPRDSVFASMLAALDRIEAAQPGAEPNPGQPPGQPPADPSMDDSTARTAARLLDAMTQARYLPTTQEFNRLLLMVCGLSGEAARDAADRAEQWMRSAMDLGLDPDAVTCRTFLEACAIGGRGRPGLAFFDAFLMRRVAADITVFDTALWTCCVAGLYDQVHGYLHEIIAAGLETTPQTFEYAIAAAGAGGSGDAAQAYLRTAVNTRAFQESLGASAAGATLDFRASSIYASRFALAGDPERLVPAAVACAVFDHHADPPRGIGPHTRFFVGSDQALIGAIGERMKSLGLKPTMSRAAPGWLVHEPLPVARPSGRPLPVPPAPPARRPLPVPPARRPLPAPPARRGGTFTSATRSRH